MMIDLPFPPEHKWSSEKRDCILCGDSQFVFLEALSNHRSFVITNGSPLFSGDAGGSECEIRKRIFDKVEKIIMLPSDMFANTGINTYLWIFGGKSDTITLFDAHDTFTKMKKSVGNMRCCLSEDDIARIIAADVPNKVFSKEHFYFNKVWLTLDVSEDSGYPKKDTEITPFGFNDNEKAISDFLEEYVRPYHDYKIIKSVVGVEINFNKEFYVPEEIGAVEDIARELMALEDEGYRLSKEILKEFV